MTTNSEQNLRPIHYLGSKLRMLDAISEAIDEIDPGGGTVCDLFAGSGTVSKHLAKTRDIVSVDVQNYSRVLCEASINKLSVDIDSNSVLEDIVNTNFSSIIQAACMPLNEYEATCLKTMKSDPGPSFEIIEKGSIYLFLNEPLSKMSSELQMAISETTHNISSINLIDSENTMILRYYGGLYFSYKQAMYLDIIAHYIFKQQGLLKTKLLAALLSTASEIVNTIGKQFAQPLKVRDKNGYYKESLSDKILSDRTINTISVFKKWMEFYLQTGEKHSVISITSNYTEAISQLKKLNVSVVYADPPYTRYHYSRY